MPQWRGSNRGQRLPRNWLQLRNRILDRDHHECQWVREDTQTICGLEANEVDHINPGDDHDPSNLRALCHWHHLRKSGREGGIASRDTRAARRAADTPTHPGLIDADDVSRMPSSRDDPAPF